MQGWEGLNTTNIALDDFEHGWVMVQLVLQHVQIPRKR